MNGARKPAETRTALVMAPDGLLVVAEDIQKLCEKLVLYQKGTRQDVCCEI